MHMNKKRKQEFELTEAMTQDFKKLIRENKIQQFRVRSAKQMLIQELSKSGKLKENELISLPEIEEITTSQKIETNEFQISNREIEKLKEEIQKLKAEIKIKERKNRNGDTIKLKEMSEKNLNTDFEAKLIQNLKDMKKEGFLPHEDINENSKDYVKKGSLIFKELMDLPLTKTIINDSSDTGPFNMPNLKNLVVALNETKETLYVKTENELKNCKNNISLVVKEIMDLKENILPNFIYFLNANPQLHSTELKEHQDNLEFVFEKLNKENLFLKDLVNSESQSLNLKPILKNKEFFGRLIEKELKENQTFYDLKETLFQIFKYIKGDTKEHAIHILNLQEELETKRSRYESKILNLKKKQNIVLNSLKDLTKQINSFNVKTIVNFELKKDYESKETEAIQVLEENQGILNERTVFYKNRVSFQNNSANFSENFKKLDFLKYNINDVIKEVEEYRIKITCLCDKNIKNAVIENCMHTFCKGCLEERLRRRERSCPICQKCYANFVIKEFYF